MSSEDQYDPAELQALIEAALSSTEEQRALFDYGNTALFEKLYPLLRKYLHSADLTVVLDELRDELSAGFGADKSNADRLRSLHGIQKACTVCTGVERDPHLPNWNLSDPDMLIVTEQPAQKTPGMELLLEGLKGAGFRSNRLCATALVRCPVQGKKVGTDHVSNCMSRYLFTEVSLLSPKLILACGSLAASALTNAAIKVTENMGSIHWVGPWPVMVTASPGYAMHAEGRKDQFFSDIAEAYRFIYG